MTCVYAAQSVAIIERSLDGITKGDYVAPFTEPPTILNSLRTDIASPIQIKAPTAKIIYIRQNKAVAAGGDMVIMDHGTRDGFKVGDVLLTARPQRLDAADTVAKESTNSYLGQLMVIQASERYATCRILRSKEEMLVGDLLTR